MLLDTHGQGQLFFQPDSLLTALYTLFALELSGQDRPRVLYARKGCGFYFTTKRKGQRFCSRQCSQLDYSYLKKPIADPADRDPD